MTSIPPIVFNPNGPQVPTEQEILAGALTDMDTAFGGGMNKSLASPQGQIATSMAAMIGLFYDSLANLVNQIDPVYAEGRMQDAIGRIYFIERKGALSTTVQATVGGGAGLLIPVGSTARAVDGNIYFSVEDVTIGLQGTATVEFACSVTGPVACPPGTLTEIYQSIPGWNTITNADYGVLGRDTESRADFEARRRASVSKNSRGSLDAILGEVYEVEDVTDAFVTENTTGTSITIGGVVLAAKSIFVAATGGDPDDVAKAIWRKKAPGANYNGNTTVTVYDDDPSYSQPYPAYDVTYQIPKSLPFLVKVTLADNSLVPADVGTRVQNAVVAAFTGSDGGPRARIGGRILASRLYGPLSAMGSWAQIVSVQIGSGNTPSAAFTASIAGNIMTVTVMAGGSGAIAVGQTVSDKNLNSVIPDTVVAALGTGTGSTGTYQLSKSNTVSSRDLVTAVASANAGQANIDQQPTIAPDDVHVSIVP